MARLYSERTNDSRKLTKINVTIHIHLTKKDVNGREWHALIPSLSSPSTFLRPSLCLRGKYFNKKVRFI